MVLCIPLPFARRLSGQQEGCMLFAVSDPITAQGRIPSGATPPTFARRFSGQKGRHGVYTSAEFLAITAWGRPPS